MCVGGVRIWLGLVIVINTTHYNATQYKTIRYKTTHYVPAGWRLSGQPRTRPASAGSRRAQPRAHPRSARSRSPARPRRRRPGEGRQDTQTESISDPGRQRHNTDIGRAANEDTRLLVSRPSLCFCAARLEPPASTRGAPMSEAPSAISSSTRCCFSACGAW